MPVSRLIIILVVVGCLLCSSSTGPALARGTGSSGTSTSGRSAGTGEAQAPGAQQTTFGGGTQQAPGLRGGISNAPSTVGGTSPASSVSFTGAGGIDTGFGQQSLSGGQAFGVGDLQQNLYAGATPSQYVGQTGPSGYSNAQYDIYNRGYGTTAGQAPAPGGGQSVQALAAPPGESASCLSTCTESYTPYECSQQYCKGK
jgi:hypothetical protein